MDFKLSDDQELIVQAYKDYMESEPWDQYFLECDEKHESRLRSDHASREPWRCRP